MKPTYLTTQELKERGWTPAMIRDLLGQHDKTRPSKMRVGRRNRLVDAEVKLYLEERVVQAEATQRFGLYQEAARARQDAAAKATETREERYRQQAHTIIDSYTPAVTPLPGVTTPDQSNWRHHLKDLEDWEFSSALDDLWKLPRKYQQQVKSATYEKFRRAYHLAYDIRLVCAECGQLNGYDDMRGAVCLGCFAASLVDE